MKEAVSGREEFDVPGVKLDLGGEGGGSEDPVEGVADVFEFGVELVAAMAEPVLQTFEQISGEVGAVAGGIAMGADDVELVGNQGTVASGRAGQPAGIEPGGGPGERVHQHAAVAVEVGRGLSGVKSALNHFEQFGDGASEIGDGAVLAFGGQSAGLHGREAAGRGRDSQGSASRAA